MRTIKLILSDDSDAPKAIEHDGRVYQVWQPAYRTLFDHGYVGVIDFMGCDEDVAAAARTSYGGGTRKLRDDIGLVRYLMRHKHTSPFEMLEVKWHVKCPVFVSRQWVRHRTASINEISGRYSKLDEEFYYPKHGHIQPQAKDNKQGRSGELSARDRTTALAIMDDIFQQSYEAYEHLLGEEESAPHFGFASKLNAMEDEAFSRMAASPNVTSQDIITAMEALPVKDFSEEFAGIARETARNVLPVSIYTQFYWKTNLLNLFRFLSLRMDPHAQLEIRMFADAMYEETKRLFPECCRAFEDYWFEAKTFSKQEVNVLRSLGIDRDEANARLKDNGLSAREIAEFWAKLGHT